MVALGRGFVRAHVTTGYPKQFRLQVIVPATAIVIIAQAWFAELLDETETIITRRLEQVHLVGEVSSSTPSDVLMSF